MTETRTHMRFTVRVAAHEQGADRTAWRIRHAAGTIGVVAAYFAPHGGAPAAQAADGTFEVHAPSWTTLDTLRQMLTDHEGLTIVSEDEVPGDAIIVAVEQA